MTKIYQMNALIAFLFVTMAVLIVGCSTTPQKMKPAPIKESSPIVPPPTRHSEGSLWRDNLSRNFYFQDTNASHVGDIVTVQVIENAKGTKDANTKSARTSSLEASTTSILGLPTVTTDQLRAGADFSDSFDGSGSTSRSGTLTASVTAVVTAVLPNGNMRIEGNREVSINAENEFISLKGIVRPEDIGPGNTILSTFIADAEIQYSGYGVLNDKQRPGWLMRIIDWIWPF